jgi:hypothetical protein
MKKQPLLTFRQAFVLAVFWLLSLIGIAACTGVAVPGWSDPGVAPPGEGLGPVIGSEQTERYHNVDLTVTAQALAAGIPLNLPTAWIPRGCSLYGHSFRPDQRLPWFFVFPDTPNYGDQVLRCQGGYRVLYWDVWRDRGKPDDRYYHEVSAPMVMGCWHNQVREDVVPVGVPDPNFPDQHAGNYQAWLTERGMVSPTAESLFVAEAQGDTSAQGCTGV